jgi:hypothetical protein
LPAPTAFAPTTSPRNDAAADDIFGLRPRSIAREKLAAVTGLPSLNRKVFRSLNVYVRPSAETVGNPAATSGTSCDPAGPERSG